MIERIRATPLTWPFALALVLVLIGLMAATSESLRRQEHSLPLTEAIQPPLPPQHSEADDRHYGPDVAGWPTP